MDGDAGDNLERGQGVLGWNDERTPMSAAERRNAKRRILKLPRSDYQRSKAEIEEDMHVDAGSVEELAQAFWLRWI